MIEDLLQPLGCTLNIPPFLNNQGQFSEDQVKTQDIANVRIHVERAISRIKSFKILQNVFPIPFPFWSISSHPLLHKTPVKNMHKIPLFNLIINRHVCMCCGSILYLVQFLVSSVLCSFSYITIHKNKGK